MSPLCSIAAQRTSTELNSFYRHWPLITQSVYIVAGSQAIVDSNRDTTICQLSSSVLVTNCSALVVYRICFIQDISRGNIFTEF